MGLRGRKAFRVRDIKQSVGIDGILNKGVFNKNSHIGIKCDIPSLLLTVFPEHEPQCIYTGDRKTNRIVTERLT